MKLEGSEDIVDIGEGTIRVTLKNTNVRELSRIYFIIQTLFDQGVFNVRNGKISLHFNDKGEMRGVDLEASKWRDGKEVISRVSMFENAIVEIIDTSGTI